MHLTMNAFRFLTCALGVVLLAGAAGAQSAVLERHYPTNDMDPVLGTCTHIYFTDEYEILTDLSSDTFLYRKHGTDAWQRSAVEMAGQHSIAYNPEQGLYYVNDTDNHRMIAFEYLSSPEIAVEQSAMAGVPLHRIHDTIYDPETGWIYALNPYDPTVFRFKALDGEIEKLDFSDELGYTRSFTLVDGTLYLNGSSLGKIIAITDWDSGDYTVYQSHDHKREGPAGSWAHTGLIPNDSAYFQGRWYVSSYFTNQYVPEPTSETDRYKLITFETWEDFETGNWEDLSDQLPATWVPYYFTVHGDNLYLAGFFDAAWEGGRHRGHVYTITPRADAE